MPVEQRHNDSNSGSDSNSDDGQAFEVRFSAALHDAGDTFDTDRGALVAAGTVRGRRLRLRRRTTVLGG
ncbi:hypothetical protein ABT404_06765, partial [Streptomyces hyaluromycini]